MKITVYGAGAIGGVTGAFAAQAGDDVSFVDIVPDHVRSINQHGLRISGLRGDFTVHTPALEPHQLQGPLDLVLLAVKSHHTAAAMDAILPHLGPDSTVVSLQNGINEELISSLIGPHRTIGCLVNWGADYQAPGHIEFGGDGPFHLGNLDGRHTPHRRGRRPGLLRKPFISNPLWCETHRHGRFSRNSTHNPLIKPPRGGVQRGTAPRVKGSWSRDPDSNPDRGV